MREIFMTVTDGLHWPDQAVVRELNDTFNRPGDGRCVLAMEGLRHLDFYGLEMLVMMNDLALEKGVTLSLRHPRGQVRTMLSENGLDRLIAIEA